MGDHRQERGDKPSKPSIEEIKKLIKDLGNDDFGTRETATKKLADMGQAVEEKLKKALEDEQNKPMNERDAEIRRRLVDILKKIDAGKSPLTKALEALKHMTSNMEWAQAGQGTKPAPLLPLPKVLPPQGGTKTVKKQ